MSSSQTSNSQGRPSAGWWSKVGCQLNDGSWVKTVPWSEDVRRCLMFKFGWWVQSKSSFRPTRTWEKDAAWLVIFEMDWRHQPEMFIYMISLSCWSGWQVTISTLQPLCPMPLYGSPGCFTICLNPLSDAGIPHVSSMWMAMRDYGCSLRHLHNLYL